MGKGGSGKSSLAGMLCRVLADQGEPVVAVDADSVPGLAQVLGLDAGDAWFLADAAVRKSDGPGWDLTMTAGEALERYAVTGPLGIRFLQMGNLVADKLGEAEAAGFAAFARMVPEFDDPNGWVVVDTLGGTLHAAAGWAGAAGPVLVVVEPFVKSLLTARRLAGLAEWHPGVRLLGIGNKISTNAQRQWLHDELQGIGIPLWAEVPADPAVVEAERHSFPLVELAADSPAMSAARDIVDRLRAEVGHSAPSSREAAI